MAVQMQGLGSMVGATKAVPWGPGTYITSGQYPGDMSHRTAVIRAGQSLEAAVAALRAGELVAIPTETVYGLAANALSDDACARIFAAKGRPRDNPLIVHICDRSWIEDPGRGLAASVPGVLGPVLDRFWPGPLTVVLPRGPAVPPAVCAGLDTVTVRMPAHPLALEIIRQAGVPLAAPSANLSGRPSPTTLDHVVSDLDGRIAFAVDGGPCAVGLESTVLDATRSPAVILRPGAITAAMLRPYLPDVVNYCDLRTDEREAIAERPATPGMKYTHYAPTSPLHLFWDDAAADAFVRDMQSLSRSAVRLTASRHCALECPRIALSDDPHDYAAIARSLFAALRAADALEPDVIVAVRVSEPEGASDADTGEPLAIMNRLEKAASVVHYAQ